MKLIPAIDIIKGKCVRLVRGKFESKKVYSSSPLKIAQLFQDAGLKRVHIVDLEGAKEGKIINWQAVKEISLNTDLFIEFGGGVRNEKDIEKLLNLGIERIIIGSLALIEPKRFKDILEQFQDTIIVAVDVKGNSIYYQGWQKKSKRELSSFLEDIISLGANTIICTNIEKDGTLKGPNFSLYRKLVKDFPQLEIIASGGVRNKKDLEKLAKTGVAGVIIGKAIYENKIKIDELKNFRC